MKFEVEGRGLRVQGPVSRVQGAGCRVQGSGVRDRDPLRACDSTGDMTSLDENPCWGLARSSRSSPSSGRLSSGFRVRVQGEGSGLRVQGESSGLRVQGSGARVQGSAIRGEGSGFRGRVQVWMPLDYTRTVSSRKGTGWRPSPACWRGVPRSYPP